MEAYAWCRGERVGQGRFSRPLPRRWTDHSNRRTGGEMDEWKGGEMDLRMHGWTDRWVDGWMSEFRLPETNSWSIIYCPYSVSNLIFFMQIFLSFVRVGNFFIFWMVRGQLGWWVAWVCWPFCLLPAGVLARWADRSGTGGNWRGVNFVAGDKSINRSLHSCRSIGGPVEWRLNPSVRLSIVWYARYICWLICYILG